MNFNLPKYHCPRFSILGRFTRSVHEDIEIRSLMDQTLAHETGPENDDGAVGRVAHFGSRFTVDGAVYRAFGDLTRNVQGDDANYELFIVNHRVHTGLPRPPRTVRSISVLMGAAPELFGAIDIECSFMFRYEEKQGYTSRVSLPNPLFLPEDTGGVTHIERVEFSRRDNDQIQYWITISKPNPQGTTSHFVRFDTMATLSRQSIQEVLDRAKSISTRLLMLKGDD